MTKRPENQRTSGRAKESTASATDRSKKKTIDTTNKNYKLPDNAETNWMGGKFTSKGTVMNQIKRRKEAEQYFNGHGEDLAWLRQAGYRREWKNSLKWTTDNYVKITVEDIETGQNYKEWTIGDSAALRSSSLTPTPSVT